MCETSSPAATGGAGTSFEILLGATFLATLLVRGAPLGLGEASLEVVHFQAGYLQAGTDDFLLEAVGPRGRAKAFIQAKQSFTLSARNVDCGQVLEKAFADFRNQTIFDQSQDIVTLVTSSLSARAVRGIRAMLDCARASLSPSDMLHRLELPAYLGKPTIDYYRTIAEVLRARASSPPDDQEIWQFLRRFHVFDLDLGTQSGVVESLTRSLLTASSQGGDAMLAEATWNELIACSVGSGGVAASYRRSDLPPAILQRHPLSTGFPEGVSRLLEDTKITANYVQNSVGGQITLPRSKLVADLCEASNEHQVTLVVGEAGTGKSGVTKAAFELATDDSLGIAFRADSLAGIHINEVLQRYGLTLENLRAQTVMQSRKVLWIDGVERLLEKPAETRRAFQDLINGLRGDGTWRVVITCRNYSADTIKSALLGGILSSLAEIRVGDLTDEELTEVTAAIPALRRPLSSPALRKLLRRPFYLDKAARMSWPDTQPIPADERAFRKKVWNEVVRRNDEGQTEGVPTRRGQAMQAVALRRAKAMEPFVGPGTDDVGILNRLVHDSLLSSPSAGSDLFAPSHDALEDWSLMQWLDERFAAHGQQIVPLLSEIGTFPALRRAYRKWLTELSNISPVTADPLILGIVGDQSIPPYWRDDTLVGILLSRGAYAFLMRNEAILLADGSKLLWQTIHMLRVACIAAVPKSQLGVSSQGYFFLPKGEAWFAVIEILARALSQIGNDHLPLILEVLESWASLARIVEEYPPASAAAMRLVIHFLPYAEGYRCPIRDAEKRLLVLLLTFPLTAQAEITNRVAAAVTQGHRDRDDISSLVFNHFYCAPIFRHLPDLGYRIVSNALGLDQSLEEAVAATLRGGLHIGVEASFGLAHRSIEDFPASALHGPYLRMLQHDSSRAADFILSFINRCCAVYSHPDNLTELEPAPAIELRLPDGTVVQQFANERIWGAYRGIGVVPDAIRNALMALESWLLERARLGDSELEADLARLLSASNNVAITGLAASIAIAYPELVPNIALSLLSSRFCLQTDLARPLHERSLRHMGFGTLSASAEEREYEKERRASAELPHREKTLEHLAVALQLGPQRSEVHALIDAHESALPPEEDQDEETRIWRIQLHRIDLRNLVPVGQTDDGRTIMHISPPAPELQRIVEENVPRHAFFQQVQDLFLWGEAAFARNSPENFDPSQWRHRIGRVRSLVEAIEDSHEPFLVNLLYAAEAYIAAAVIRDKWEEMTEDEKEWAAQAIYDSIETDCDTADFLSIVAVSTFDASRPAARTVFALFGKNLPTSVRAELLPAMARAAVHAVEEVVVCAIHGISAFLWNSNRHLALTCLNAIITVADEKHRFHEHQLTLNILERQNNQLDTVGIMARARRLIEEQVGADEQRLSDLNLTLQPGRALAKAMLLICREHPEDEFSRRVVSKQVGALIELWRRDQQEGRRRRGVPGGESDLEIEMLLVKEISSCLLSMEPNQAAQFFGSFIAAIADFPEKVAEVIKWLVLSQGDQPDSSTFWELWQMAANAFNDPSLANASSRENSGAMALVRELFLGYNWRETRDWPPMSTDVHRPVALFERLPASAPVIAMYAYFLAHAGSNALPDALAGFARKLPATGSQELLHDNAIFHLEQVIERLVAGGDGRIRAEPNLRSAVLTILDALVAGGSSLAYKLRDDFVTPIQSPN